MKFLIPDEHKHASGIYIIRNMVNGKVYVGSAVNFWFRFRKHRNNLLNENHHSQKLQRSYNKHGAHAFIFELAEVASSEKAVLLSREQHWIEKMECCDIGFNHAPVAGTTLGVKHSAESRAARIGIPRSEETKKRISEAHKGKIQKPFTPEQRERQKLAVSEAAKKRKGIAPNFTPEQRERQKAAASEASKGRIKSPEEREKIAASKRGKPRSEATRLAISTANKGNPKIGRPKGTKMTEQQRAKLSAAKKGSTFSEAAKEKRRATLELKKQQSPLLVEETKRRLSEAAKLQWQRIRSGEIAALNHRQKTD